jgi:hypothetical protein
MFGNASLVYELEVYALGLDLGAIKQVLGAVEAEAARYPGWEPVLWRARGEYERLRGNLDDAHAAFARCMAATAPAEPGEHPDELFFGAAACAVETLLELGRLAQAKDSVDAALAHAGAAHSGVRYHPLRRARALVAARLGDFASAEHELEALIDAARAAGTSGVRLGVLHEARTLVAAWRGDAEAAKRALDATREQLLRCPASGFSARYERLRAALRQTPAVAGVLDENPASLRPARADAAPATEVLVEHTLSACPDAAARAQHGLALLNRDPQASRGYLYLLRASGLSLVAALSENLEPEGIAEFVSSLFEAEIEGYDQPTMTAMLTAAADPSALLDSGVFEDAALRYVPVWIRARLGNESSLVGIAMLGHETEVVLSPRTTDLACALGSYLLRAGDTVVTEWSPAASAAR